MIMNKTSAALAALLLATAAQRVSAHAVLIESAPKNGEAVAAPLAEMRLKYNEPLETGFSRVRLFGPDGKELDVGKIQAVDGDPNAVSLPLPGLKSGVYKAQWSAMGRDGHRTKGELSFTVK